MKKISFWLTMLGMILLLLSMVLSLSACKKKVDEGGAAADVVVSDNDNGMNEEQTEIEKNDPVQKEEEKEEPSEEEQQEDASSQENSSPLNYDLKDGILTITGKGEVRDYYPWVFLSEGEKDEHAITKLVLSEGITGVYNSFNHLVALKEIEFPTTLEIIDESFNDAFSLAELVVPKTVKKIVNYSFRNAYSLKEVHFEGAIELGHPSAFTFLPIESVIIPEGSKLCGTFSDCLYLKEVVIEPNVYYGSGRFIDGGDAVYNFEKQAMTNGGRIYMCAPINEEGIPLDNIYCGEYGACDPIIVPEGEDWKDYKDVPLPYKGNDYKYYEKMKKEMEEKGYNDEEHIRKHEAKKKAAMERVST